MAVWFVSLFFECAFIELLQTEAAHKVFWMEFSEHSSDATTLKTRILSFYNLVR